MALDLRLEAKLSQSLVMTPRLQQAIKLLQYNHMEMVDHIQEAILENPTLEVVPDSDLEAPTKKERELIDGAEKLKEDTVEQSNGDEGNIDWEKILNQMEADRGPRMTGASGMIYDDLPPIETNLTYGENLSDHLTWQLSMLKCSEEEGRMASTIIHNLDARGYLVESLEGLAEQESVPLEVARDALEIVQSLDPIGCGARDLIECLLLQARHLYREDDTFERLITAEHLANLERRNYAAIARDLLIDEVDVIEYHRMLQELEPHPGRAHTTEEPRYITPDVYVVKRGDEWVVTLNEDGMPDLRVSRYYQKVLSSASKKDKDYLLDKLRGAEFLIKSINKRRTTIRRVMESILKFQREFFERGAEGLRPLVLQDVADEVGVHMSTVSRVTTNKYVHTAHGIFELKYFFPSGVKQQVGGDVAAEAIKTRIKELVGGEDGTNPLSDQAIADALKKDGVKVARRTVAKYREALEILPSSQRKRMF